MTTEKIGYDSLYKRALGTARQLAQFLQAFDPQTAGLLRLDSIEPRGTELFDVLPAWYRRVADSWPRSRRTGRSVNCSSSTSRCSARSSSTSGNACWTTIPSCVG